MLQTSGGPAKVSLHPVASRHGDQSSTLVSVNLPTTQPGTSAGGRPEEAVSSPSAPAKPSHATRYPKAEAAEWGIQHGDLERYVVLDDGPTPLELEMREKEESRRRRKRSASIGVDPTPSGAPPIRAMSAGQLAELHQQYVALDVPHSVVFPFLHGVDGNIAAQNVFFGAPMSGQPTPNYRGLTVVRADMPTPEEEAAVRKQERQRGNSTGSSTSEAWQSDGHIGLGIDATVRQRASSTCTSQSLVSSSSSLSSISDADEDRQDWHASAGAGAVPINTHAQQELPSPSSKNGRPRAMTSSASSASVTSSTMSSNRSGPSLFSVSSTIDSLGSQTSFGSASDDGDLCGSKVGRSGHVRSRSSSLPYQAQPKHSVLNSTVFPGEILIPPSTVRVMYGRNVYGDLSCPGSFGDEDDREVKRIGAAFVSPPQAAGVSLRNFKIQCAKYATISDIVVYCPTGYHPGVLRLAQWFREAQDALWRDRQGRGLGGLRYNVFVVAEPFEVFEQSFPDLVAIDSCGYSRNRVDFVDREREEMQRLTAASEIDDNVWLGCTADLPGFSESDSQEDEPLTPDDGGNPLCFSICIEAHEMAMSPNKARLSHASHFLDAIEATALFEIDSRQALRKLAEEEEGTWPTDEASLGRNGAEHRGGSLVLGPNGWTPMPCNGARSGGLTNVPLMHHARWGSSGGDRSIGGVPRAACNEVGTPLMLEPSSVIHMECPSTFQNCNSEQQVTAIIDGILLLCAWIKTQAKPTAAAPGTGSASVPRPRRVLLHCGDGYTETSIVALSYLMYSRGLSLPEAYLDLQLRAKRSFFVYARDLAFLRKVESSIVEDRKLRERLLTQEKERERDADVKGSRIKHSASRSYSGNDDRFSLKLGLGRSNGHSRRSSVSSPASDPNPAATSSSNEPSVWARSLAAASGLVSGSSHIVRKTPSNSRLSGALHSRARTPTPKDDRPSSTAAPCGPKPAKTEFRSDYRWFDDVRFEGSFPSRILPFLYLGNLNHALNAHMLHALGITHVVSVGESAIAPASCDVNGNRIPAGQHMTSSPNFSTHNSLWHEHSTGRISVLDLKNVSDDGIDPLRDTMREAVEYIEGARRGGGKVLVHCRVGVSRSTTIVLAYVMAHLDLSLVESYLLVRSRRLNILIQPHLLFFWELRGWETFLAKEKERRTKFLRKKGHRSIFESPDSNRTRQMPNGLSDTFTELSIHSSSCYGRSDYSGSYRSASSSPSASPFLLGGGEGDAEAAAGHHDSGDVDEPVPELDVDLAAGAGSVYGFKLVDAEQRSFGSGSAAGLPYASMRLLWGHFAREIADLNSRYFV
ncbi:tyrosine/serine/threonine protein phosphatase pps1 [Thecaphora frezii]